jgi:hypothetical protein
MKTLLKGVIFLSIEFYFYSKTSSAGLESFFFGWGFLFLALFIYSTFGAAFEGSTMSSSGGIMNVKNQHRENVKRSLSGRSNQAFSGILDRKNILYLVLLIINIIGYIRIMPR